MKTLALLAAVLVLVGVGGDPGTPARYAFTDAGTVQVDGTSSLHDWTCDAAGLTGWIDAEVAAGTLTAIPRAEITVRAALDCKNGTMDKKARKALDADAHPAIQFVLDGATVEPGAGAAFAVQVRGRLRLAGAERPVAFTAEGRVLGNGAIRLAGQIPVTMSDFGIEPPTAMLGALKTGDAVTVRFDAVAAPTREL